MQTILIYFSFFILILSLVKLVVPNCLDDVYRVAGKTLFSFGTIISIALSSSLPSSGIQNIFHSLNDLSLFSSVVFAIAFPSYGLIYLTIIKRDAPREVRYLCVLFMCVSFVGLVLSLYPYYNNPILFCTAIGTLFPPAKTVFFAILKSFKKNKDLNYRAD